MQEIFEMIAQIACADYRLSFEEEKGRIKITLSDKYNICDEKSVLVGLHTTTKQAQKAISDLVTE